MADAEAGFGGALNCFELTKAMIEAGAAGVHFEDQLASEKKCGHMGGKVLLPTAHAIRNLVAARLAADVQGVPTILVARTDADGGGHDHLRRRRARRRVHHRRAHRGGLLPDQRRASTRRSPVRSSYAPYADLIWCETSEPDHDHARQFAEAVHEQFPDKKLAYNCSPSFNWKSKLSDDEIASFQDEIAKLGYVFQFVTLAGFHSLNLAMFELADGYRDTGMKAFSALQQQEFAAEDRGFTATKHQRQVGAGYFDEVAEVISGGSVSTGALEGSTESRSSEG